MDLRKPPGKCSKFWDVIEETRGADDQPKVLRDTIRKLPRKQFLTFVKCWVYFIRNLDSEDMYFAVALIQGGCSLDIYLDEFRPWLVAQGKQFYFKAIKDPEVLAQKVGFYESLNQSIYDVYKEVFNAEIPLDDPIMFPKQVDRTKWSGADPTDQELAQKFPELWRRFGAMS